MTEHLARMPPVGVHKPEWAGTDCPSCGSAPCGPHPDVLICRECCDEWPCDVVANVAAELDRLVGELSARADRRDQIAGDEEGQCEEDCWNSGACHVVAAVGTWHRAAHMLQRRAAELRGEG